MYLNHHPLLSPFERLGLEIWLHFDLAEEGRDMLRITTEAKRGRTTLCVEGRLAGQWVAALHQCWRELRIANPKDKFSVNLCGVSFIDNGGKVLLKEIYESGGELIAEGCLNQAIVHEIVGEQEKGGSRNARGTDRPKGSTIIFYVALLSLWIPAGLLAQQLPANPPTTTLKLTLSQAVTWALKQNPTQQIGLLNAAESIQDKNITRSQLWPQASLGVTDSANRVNLEAEFGGLQLGTFPHHLGPYQIFTAGPSFSTPIFDFSLWKRYQAAQANVTVAKANSNTTTEQVILLVVSQYIGTLRAMANVEASRSRVELAQALYDQAADLQKEGVGTGIDTLRANVELQNEKQRLIEAENDREASLFGLSKLLNLDPQQKTELADSLSFFETPQPDVEASIDEALSNRPEWKAIAAQQRAAHYDKQSALYSRLPTLGFDGYWEYLGTSISNGIPTYKYEAAFNIPLITGGRIKAQVTRADIEMQKIEQQREDLRNQIALDVKTSLLNLQSARNEVQVANLGVQLAKDEVNQARDRFQAGVANNIEVIQAQDSLSRANDNQILALYRFNQARADFARSVGQMEKAYRK